MKKTVAQLKSVQQTVNEMVRLGVTYRNDVAQFGSMSLTEFYNLLRELEYHPDPEGRETLMRPAYTLMPITANIRIAQAGDCDDKAICVIAYCALNRIPCRVVVASSKPHKKPHHVFCDVFYGGKWVSFDPTYTWCNFGIDMRPYTLRKVLKTINWR